MKKTLYLFFTFSIFAAISSAQPICGSTNLLTNADFSAGLTNWTQYGTITTAQVLPTSNGCLNNFLALQATNNSDCGVEQLVTLKKDTCYDLCYCVEFPPSGSLFNAKLTIAAITSGVTVSQLLSGSFTAAQAQIIDVITSNSAISPYIQCPGPFQSAGNYTSIVIVNQTIGNIGTDVRVDNLCLIRHQCPVVVPSCDSVNANFSYSVTGNTATFTDLSTLNIGDTPSWSWDFGDPPSGVNNTSILQNPSHTYPGPGVYFVCLYLSTVSSDGLLACQDTFCLDVVIPGTVGIENTERNSLVIIPNPANDHLFFSGSGTVDFIVITNTTGQTVFEDVVRENKVTLPATLADGIYYVKLTTNTGMVRKKILIKNIM